MQFSFARLSLALTAVALFCAFVFSSITPLFAGAQTYIINENPTACPNTTAARCNPGKLHVYVLVNNSNDASMRRAPGEFAVTVTSPQSSPVSFPGSQSGVNLSVMGAYEVTAAPIIGYNPEYSVGCSGSVTNGQDATCVITEAGGLTYNQAPVPYPYPYTASVLSCNPQTQTVTLGQSARFSVGGTASGPYTWSTPTRSYQATGPVFSTTFDSTGTQLVTVSNNAQFATCTVTVVAGAVISNVSPVAPIAPVAPAAPAYTAGYAYTPTPSYAPVSVKSYVVPSSLPNTGFAPLSATQVATLLAVFTALGILGVAHLRKISALVG